MDFLAVSGIQKHLSLDFYLTERIFQLSGAQQMLECFEKSRVSGVGPNLGWLGPNVKRFVGLSKCAITAPNLDTSDAPPVWAHTWVGGR